MLLTWAWLPPECSFPYQVYSQWLEGSVLLWDTRRDGERGLIAFLVPVTLWMHAYWRLSDPVTFHIQQAMFAKNLSMLGAALLISQFGAGPVSIDERKSRGS
jgi:putative oxidoreductase